jgi:hypothetical protein
MAYWKVRYFSGILLQEKNRKSTDIHEHKQSVTATSNLVLSLRGALHIYTVGSEVLKVATMTTTFKDATSCGPKDKYQSSEGSWRFHLRIEDRSNMFLRNDGVFIPDYTQNSLWKEHERTEQTLTHLLSSKDNNSERISLVTLSHSVA